MDRSSPTEVFDHGNQGTGSTIEHTPLMLQTMGEGNAVKNRRGTLRCAGLRSLHSSTIACIHARPQSDLFATLAVGFHAGLAMLCRKVYEHNEVLQDLNRI